MAVKAFGATHTAMKLTGMLTVVDRVVLTRTGGRRTILGPIGIPTILLTTAGRRTGKPRISPLLCVHDGDVLYVVGSNLGKHHHPAWTENLLADARATVTVGGQTIAVRAELLDRSEADIVFPRFVEIAHAYHVFRDRTSREMRVFALTRV